MTDERALQALVDTDEQLLRLTLRHAVPPGVFKIAGDNLLRHHSAQALAFQPGQRTRDDGKLGELQATTTFDLNPPPGNSVQWSLQDATGRSLASVIRNDGGPVSVAATSGGRYVLTAQRTADQQLLGAAQLSLPAFIRIQAQLGDNAPTLSSLGVPDAQHAALWQALIAAARPVAQHILRPINVRLIWDEDAQPGLFQPAAAATADPHALAPTAAWQFDTDSGPQQLHLYPGTVVLLSPGTFVNRTPAALAALLQGLTSNITILMLRQLFAQFIELPDSDPTFPRRFNDEPAWGLDAALSFGNFALLRCGLGALDYQGQAVDARQGTDAERALAVLAGAVDWHAPQSPRYLRFVEFAARQMGACIAHAVLRLLGVPATEHGGHLQENAPGQQVVVSSITAAQPADALRDLLGLRRPATEPARSIDELPADLEDQTQRSGDDKPPQSTRWVDVAALESALWRTGTLAEPMRAMPGITSKYDVLAGLVDPQALALLESRLGTLPPAYGDVTFAPGDRDAVAEDSRESRYGGQLTPRTNTIELIQRDLAAVGIGIGLQDRGDYAYRRVEASLDRYDGVAADRRGAANQAVVKDGNTGWAVREFQIACRYPQRVVESLSGAAHYADQLHVIAPPDGGDAENSTTPAVADDLLLTGPDPHINGELDILTAHRLRTWRFTRQRYPIVISTGTTAGVHQPATQAGSPLPTVENLHRTDGAPSTQYRMYTFDHSGAFGAPATPIVLGDWTDGMWRGPRASRSHAQMPVTPGSVLGVEEAAWQALPAIANETAAQRMERERRERFLDVYKVIASVAKVEAIGHFDGLNAYDNAVFSYPLFHHTLGLSRGRPAQMAAFVRWLQQPQSTLLASAFPDTPEDEFQWSGHYDPTALRAALKRRMQQVYSRCFGRFGVGASAVGGGTQTGFLTVAGLETAATDSGAQVDMRLDWNAQNAATQNRQQALHQAYQQWFRTWHWCYRFAAGLRHDQTLRTLLFAYEADWIERTFSRSTELANDVRTQQGRALAVRIKVRGLAQFSLAQARKAAAGQTDEAAAIRTAIKVKRDSYAASSENYKSLNGLYTGTGTVADFHETGLRPWQSGAQPNDIYRRVRDDLLRSLAGENQ